MRDRRIALMRPGPDKEVGTGTEKGDYEEVEKVWASYLPTSATERVEAMRDSSSQFVRLEIIKDSKWAAIDHKWVIRYPHTEAGPTHDVRAVSEKRRGYLILDCVRAD